jgi:epoxyqueuosine reductase
MTTDEIAQRLKARARELGFALVGIAPATKADGFPRYRKWLERGFAGEMVYLHHQGDLRRHPESVLAGARSVVMLGLEYFGMRNAECGTSNQDQGTSSSNPNSALRTPHFGGRVAAYAAGPDYHRFIWDRLNVLAEWLMAEAPGSCAHGVTDTAPLLERDFARRAGLGWIGKNTMLIHPERGSFFFLAALLTDLELPFNEPFAGSHCGTCTACLDACPTQAFPEPHILDATKCISYLTIELRSPIPEELREPMGDWLFGCDVCQDVCPWNRKPSSDPVAFPREPGLERLDLIELLRMDAETFRNRFKTTSIWRTRRAGLLRNAAIVLGNTGDEQALPALERALADEEELVREAAAWAIEQIGLRSSSLNPG